MLLINFFTTHLDETNALKIHLIESAPYFRFLMIGVGLLVIMRYRPKGLIPEKINVKKYEIYITWNGFSICDVFK